MSSPSHPYTKSPPSKDDTEDNDNVSMQDNSLSSKALELEGLKQETAEENKDKDSSHNCNNWVAEEEIEFEENHFQIPPSFNHLITEEMLCHN